MSLYADYLNEIESRKEQGLNPKPIDDGALVFSKSNRQRMAPE